MMKLSQDRPGRFQNSYDFVTIISNPFNWLCMWWNKFRLSSRESNISLYINHVYNYPNLFLQHHMSYHITNILEGPSDRIIRQGVTKKTPYIHVQLIIMGHNKCSYPPFFETRPKSIWISPRYPAVVSGWKPLFFSSSLPLSNIHF